MLRFTLLRILHAVPLLIAVILVIFLMQQMIPGDPVQAMVGDFPVPQAFRDAIELRYRLNDPLYVRIWSYFANLAQGDFGFSYHSQRPVLELILERAPRTILLASAGFAVAIPLGMVIGVLTGTTRRAGVDQAWTTTTLVLYAVLAGTAHGAAVRGQAQLVPHARHGTVVVAGQRAGLDARAAVLHGLARGCIRGA